MNPSTVAEQRTSGNEALFTAFRDQRSPTSYRWALALVVPLLGALATWASFYGEPEPMRVITPSGIKHVYAGMPQQDALARLGHPIGKEVRADGAECFYYGVLSLTEPATTVFLVCYVDGQVKDVMTRRYALWSADGKGGFAPAGVPWEDEAAPAAKPGPAATP